MTGQQLYEATASATTWPWPLLERRTQRVFELAAALGTAQLVGPEDVKVDGVSGAVVLREIADACPPSRPG